MNDEQTTPKTPFVVAGGRDPELDIDPIREQINKKLPPEERQRNVAIAQIKLCLENLGFLPDSSSSTIRTPERWVNYLQEFMQPYELPDIFGAGFDAVHDNSTIAGIVAQAHIPFVAICEHHLLPFQGEAFIGYIPNHKIVGLSKIPRLVHAISHERPGLQEAMTEKIADALFGYIDSKASMCTIRATHSCMGCRGINTPEVVTITSAVRGLFRDVPAAREELMTILGLRR